MNNWEKFAEILGLKLEQEFVLINVDGKRKNEYIYKITEDGLLYKMPTQYINWSNSSSGTIVKLLNGNCKALVKPWKPKNGETYWYYRIKREEAETKGKEIMEQIQKEYEEA